MVMNDDDDDDYAGIMTYELFRIKYANISSLVPSVQRNRTG